MNSHGDMRAAENSDAIAWVEVTPGVHQRLLEEMTGPAFRQTRLLQLAAGAELVFTPTRSLDGGEDILVLEGTLVADEGDYPAGTYIGLPAGDRPRLWSPHGCRLFAKSRPSARRTRTVVATRSGRWESSHTPGFWVMRLDEQTDGRAVLLRFDAGTVLGPHRHEAGEEFFVLRGALRDEEGTYGANWWVRQPPESTHSVVSDDGCLLFTTAGHLG